MNKRKWIGVMGGSFNPPHVGHLLACIYALQVFEFDEIWLVPVYHHPWQKVLVPFQDRVEMCKRLIERFSPYVRISTIEQKLRSHGRTLHTLLALRKMCPQHRFSLVIGSDLLRQKGKWYRFQEIEDRFGVWAVPRGNVKGHPFGIPNISSTDVRRHLGNPAMLGRLTTASVASYILEKGLFRQ